jgi:hypothetical protein
MAQDTTDGYEVAPVFNGDPECKQKADDGKDTIEKDWKLNIRAKETA